MATLTGHPPLSPLWHDSHLNDAALASLDGDILDLDAAAGPGASLGGAATSTQPVTEPARAIDGGWAGAYSDDYYHRIWILPTRLALGNIVGSQSAQIEVWNAYLTPQTLREIRSVGEAGGLELDGATTTPATWYGLQSETYTLSISESGPASISVSYTWDFGLAVPTIPATGRRVVAWPWLPDWSAGVVERVEYRTDLRRAWDGTEQRARLRTYPRTGVEFEVVAIEHERRNIEAALYGWQGRAWALPLWHGQTRLTAEASAGAGALSVQSADLRGLVSGGLAVLTDGAASETVFVAAASGASVTLASGLLATWPAGTRLYPARIARIEGAARRDHYSPEVTRYRLRFGSEDLTALWSAADGPDSYRGGPVWDQRPNRVAPVSHESQSTLQVLDPGVGLRVVEDPVGRPVDRIRHLYTRSGRAAIATLRARIEARRGRWAGCWLPSYQRDLTIVEAWGANDLALDVSLIDYRRFLLGLPGRQDVQVVLVTGARGYARITDAEVLDASTERLTLAAGLGISGTPATVARVSFLRWCRLAGDAAEIRYRVPEVAECELTWEGCDDGL